MRASFALATAALSVVAVSIATTPASAAACAGEPAAIACACSPRAPAVDRAYVEANVDDLLRSEGFPSSPVLTVTMRTVELDDDPSTSEALVDVFAPGLCFGLSCPTIVVQRSAAGDYITLGRGLALHPQRSRAAGWADLRESVVFPLPGRTLQFSQGRYR